MHWYKGALRANSQVEQRRGREARRGSSRAADATSVVLVVTGRNVVSTRVVLVVIDRNVVNTSFVLLATWGKMT